MKWWREARFGLFIHWGVYSVSAGVHEGREVPGIGEWIMHSARIPVSSYQKYASSFNPTKYDPDAWVRAARDAGMKYIVITAKHHDGFALFDSKASDWDVVDATPYRKDLLAPLAQAAERHGLRLGFYYSQAQDWVNAGGGVCGERWDDAQRGDMLDYVRRVAVPQVKELLTGYGKVSVLWWDTPCGMDATMARELRDLTSLQPGIIENDRLGAGFRGDTDTPEQHIPATGIANRDWETCMTMNDTWGYKSNDQNWKSSETLVRNLVDIVSKGGNYLLNVGPTAEGTIPEPSLRSLRDVGAFMKVNGAAIYGTTASPFRRLPWGRATQRSNGATTTIYLHVFDWPKDGSLRVPGLTSPVTNAYLLADARQAPLAHRRTADGLAITVPKAAPTAYSSTIVLTVTGTPVIEVPPIVQQPDGTLTLTALDAELHGKELRYESGERRDNIGYWTNPTDFISWSAEVGSPGRYTVTAEVASLAASAFTVTFGSTELSAKVPNTGDYGSFTTVEVGTVTLTERGRLSVAVRPVASEWKPVNLRAVRLRRLER
jgi:alpha-L-fucosidase